MTQAVVKENLVELLADDGVDRILEAKTGQGSKCCAAGNPDHGHQEPLLVAEDISGRQLLGKGERFQSGVICSSIIRLPGRGALGCIRTAGTALSAFSEADRAASSVGRQGQAFLPAGR